MLRRRRRSRYNPNVNTTSTQIGLDVDLGGRSGGPGSYRWAFRRMLKAWKSRRASEQVS